MAMTSPLARFVAAAGVLPVLCAMAAAALAADLPPSTKRYLKDLGLSEDLMTGSTRTSRCRRNGSTAR
jgi:hypothetical protein